MVLAVLTRRENMIAGHINVDALNCLPEHTPAALLDDHGQDDGCSHPSYPKFETRLRLPIRGLEWELRRVPRPVQL